MNQCLKKSDILRNKKEISLLFRSGEWRRGKLVNIVFNPSETKKVLFATARGFGNAVMRHRGKRYLREIYRTNKDLFPSLFTYGIILKRMPSKKPYSRIFDDIRSVMTEN